MADRSWLQAFYRTAGLRLCILPVSAAMALLSGGLTIHFAGATVFGFITMVGQLQLALPFADLGLGAAVARAVAQEENSEAARWRAQQLLRRTALLLSVISLCGAGAVIALGTAGVWSNWFAVPEALAADLDVVMTAVLVLFFLGLPLGLSERVLVGQDRADLLVLLGIVPAACNLALVAVIGTLGLRPMWLALGLPVGAAVFLLLCCRAAGFRGRCFPPSGLSGSAVAVAGGAVPPSLLHIMRDGLPVVVATAGVVLAEQHGRFVLGRIAAPEVMSEYALGLFLYMPVYSVMYMGATVLWPRFARGADLRMWGQANGALILLGCGAAGGYLLFARPLSDLVSGGELILSWPVTVGFALVFVAQSAHLTQANLLTDPRGFRRQAAMAMSLLASVVPLTVLGTHLGWGAAAPAAAMVLGVTFTQVIPGMLTAVRAISAGDIVRGTDSTPEIPSSSQKSVAEPSSGRS